MSPLSRWTGCTSPWSPYSVENRVLKSPPIYYISKQLHISYEYNFRLPPTTSLNKLFLISSLFSMNFNDFQWILPSQGHCWFVIGPPPQILLSWPGDMIGFPHISCIFSKCAVGNDDLGTGASKFSFSSTTFFWAISSRRTVWIF